MQTDERISLPSNYGVVTLGLSYDYGSPYEAFAMIKIGGHTFVVNDEATEIQVDGDKILVPRRWFWQLFRPVSPEVTGFSFDLTPALHDPEISEPLTYYLFDGSPLVVQLFEAVAAAVHQHSDDVPLREKALRALRDLQSMGLIEMPLLGPNQYRGTIRKFEWPYAIIDVPPHHAVRMGGQQVIRAHKTQIVDLKPMKISSYKRHDVIFELGEPKDGQPTAVSVQVLP